ncbi:MAG: hypothetical protein OEZ01_09195 [Candidatus Heimdallarchaeota archaeon]|nr:hypothetical protein [Candidatus Heimdallarchaeota archaeon]MDH5646170.1 hypothetical protein [Candidatus Heimdallarchaeota archaeon]
MKFVLYFMTLIFAAIGAVISFFVVDSGILGIEQLINALVWFLISYMTYWGAKKIDDTNSFKLLSLDFFLTWIFCTIGVLVGFIIWSLIQTKTATINIDALTNVFFKYLPYTIGPTATASLGLD